MARIDVAYFYMVLVVLKFLVRILDLILDNVFGFTITKGDRLEYQWAEKSYEHSAQVVDVWFCANWSFAFKHTPDNYLYTHNRYVHPDYILKNDKVTLQGVTETHAYFCVSDDDKDVYDTKSFPFLFISQ